MRRVQLRANGCGPSSGPLGRAYPEPGSSDSERPEELWLGHRDRANEVLLRNPALLEAAAAARTGLPAGHAEGFADTFKELYRVVYGAVAAGAMPDEPDFPSFADGHRENLIGEAVARSARERGWVEVPR